MTSELYSQRAARVLKQDDIPVEVTVVATSQELLDAVDDGAVHIEIRDHLDLTRFTPLGFGSNDYLSMLTTPGQIHYLGQSIRVCILTPPSRWFVADYTRESEPLPGRKNCQKRVKKHRQASCVAAFPRKHKSTIWLASVIDEHVHCIVVHEQ